MKQIFIAIALLCSLTLTSANAVEVTVEEKITGLYVAYFNRAADQAGLEYWKTTADNVEKQGGDVSSVFKTLSGGFATHPTFTLTYAHLTNEEFVAAIYRNALGRDGDAEGIDYWTDLLDRGMIRSDMVATFVELSMVTDLTPEDYPTLSTEELAAAQLRQDLITNKVTVALKFTRQLGTLSNVVDNDDPESDPAYIASVKIISEVTEENNTVSSVSDCLDEIKESSDPIVQINKFGCSYNLNGTFATGRGQEGTILVRGAKGNEVIGVSNQDGSFSIDVSSLTPPYKIKAETVNKDTVFYSYSETKEYTNINQLTTIFLKETLQEDSLNYLFEDNILLSKEVISDTEKAIKDGLLVQIYSTGMDANELSIFKTKFDTNKLGYDAILEKFNDDGSLKITSNLSVNESKDVQRLLSHFYIKDKDGKTIPDSRKLSKDVLNNFYTSVVVMATDKEYLKPIEFDEGGKKIKSALTDMGSDLLQTIVINEIKQLFIESFGTLLGFSDEDKELITQLSNLTFKNNIYDAVAVMSRGLRGEDTSQLYDPLLEALHNSTLGDPVLAAKELNTFFGLHGTVSSVVCKIPILNTGREESCEYIENDGLVYTIDFDEYKTVEVTKDPTGFQVISILPQTGREAKTLDMNDQAISIEFNQKLFQSDFFKLYGGTSATMNIFDITKKESFGCDNLKVIDENKLLCTFNNNQIKYNSKYAFSVTAENITRSTSLSIFSTFSTPAFLVNTIEISKESGKYSDNVEVTITIPNGYEIYYTLNSANLNIGNAILYAEGRSINIDKTSVLRVVVYKNGIQVSPVARKVYNIVITPEEIIEAVKEDEITTPIDTSTLTASECTEKITNQEFSTNTWTTSLTEWNNVALACLPILAGISNDDDTNIDNDSHTDTTSLTYMRTHPNDKLASSDCKAYIGGGGTVSLVWVGNTLTTPIVLGTSSWSDVKGALGYDLAPANNMMKSIEACQWIQTAVDSGQLTFDQAVDIENRDKEPFSDSPSISADSTITIPDTDTDNTHIPTEILTLAICKTDYANYTNSMWAQTQAFSDTASKAAACYQALVAGPMFGIDGQLYIDAYNEGIYSY